ncbi:MAG TPA: rod-binding protein [Stellaceae bacterium]|nr:rod-binding protein [Stellaceae bacterium]
MDSLAAPLPTTTSVDGATPTTTTTADPATAHKTAENFESFFLSQVFENMFAGVGTDSLFGGGNAETVYRSLLLQQYSKVAAKAGGVGIADAVQREILRTQETQ